MTNAPRRPFSDRVARRLVRLLPAQFRFDFRTAIEADLDERLRDNDQAGLVRHDVPSLIRAIGREHLTSFVGALREDVKYALRMMGRTPGFTAIAVLMLALGTGVNAALFSVIDAVMLRTPFTDPDRIAILRGVDDRQATAAISPERFGALAAAPGPFGGVAGLAVARGEHTLTGAGDPRRLNVECVSSSMFDVLGAKPALGRTFSAEEDRAGADPVMVISDEFWRRLGGAAGVAGTTVMVNQTPVTIVGVMPRGFGGPLSRSNVEAWLPFHRPIAGGGSTGCSAVLSVNVFVRLRDGVSLAAANAAMPHIQLTPIEEQTYGDLRQPFLALTMAVACVLLIACFNVSGLQMERTLARRRDLALRLALGASLGRLVRQAVTENVMLALVGAAAGLASTWFTLRAIVSLLPAGLPHLDQIAMNGRVLVVTVAIASAAGVAAGVLPIGMLRRLAPGAHLTASARAGDRHGTLTRRSLVVVEIALSVVVLIGAALMIQTFVALRPTNPGFDASHKTSLAVRLPGATPDVSAQFYEELLNRLRSVPGVRGAAGSTYLPVSGSLAFVKASFGGISIEINTSAVTDGYFDLMRVPLRSGRAFRADDTRTSEPVAMVNEFLARRIQADGQVLGSTIGVTSLSRFDQGDRLVQRRIVGVVANTRSFGSDTRPRSEVYVPYAQDPLASAYVITEASAGSDASVAAAMRAGVRALRPDLAVNDVEALPAMLDRSVSFWRFGAWLLGVFAALAVVLAAIGLMTTIGWWVRQRTRELGVRIALGATRGAVTGLVFRQGLAIAAVGIAGGCAIATGTTRYLQSWIYGVTPLDLRTFAGCSAGMLVVAVVATYLPVRRATSVDPVVALRAE